MLRSVKGLLRGSMAALVVTAGLASCATTTVPTAASDTTAVGATTTLPTGPASVLLPRLVTEAGKLSNIIGDAGHSGEQLDIILDLYNAVRPEIAATDGVAALNFDGVIELCKTAKQFKRPADADKCSRNLSALADAYLAKHP